jgi:hypothetical protein
LFSKKDIQEWQNQVWGIFHDMYCIKADWLGTTLQNATQMLAPKFVSAVI